MKKKLLTIILMIFVSMLFIGKVEATTYINYSDGSSKDVAEIGTGEWNDQCYALKINIRTEDGTYNQTKIFYNGNKCNMGAYYYVYPIKSKKDESSLKWTLDASKVTIKITSLPKTWLDSNGKVRNTNAILMNGDNPTGTFKTILGNFSNIPNNSYALIEPMVVINGYLGTPYEMLKQFDSDSDWNYNYGGYLFTDRGEMRETIKTTSNTGIGINQYDSDNISSCFKNQTCGYGIGVVKLSWINPPVKVKFNVGSTNIKSGSAYKLGKDIGKGNYFVYNSDKTLYTQNGWKSGVDHDLVSPFSTKWGFDIPENLIFDGWVVRKTSSESMSNISKMCTDGRRKFAPSSSKIYDLDDLINAGAYVNNNEIALYGCWHSNVKFNVGSTNIKSGGSTYKLGKDIGKDNYFIYKGNELYIQAGWKYGVTHDITKPTSFGLVIPQNYSFDSWVVRKKSSEDVTNISTMCTDGRTKFYTNSTYTLEDLMDEKPYISPDSADKAIALYGCWKITPTGNITIQKKDSSGNNIYKNDSNEVAQFGLYSNSSCTNVIKGPTPTNNSGQLTFSNLTYGTYYIKETTAPKDFNLDSTCHQVVLN